MDFGKTHLDELFPEELAHALKALNVPAFRAKQIFSWVHRRSATDFSAMTDLSADLRTQLADRFLLTPLHKRQAVTASDGTTKFVFALVDGETVESVYIPDGTRGTVCISTMVGCPFRCAFCATGQAGFVRNLTAAEIVAQVYGIHASLPEGRQITNVVYMGMGEPLANYDAVIRSVRLLIHPLGLNIAQRRITISTVGITPGMERLAEEGLQVNLAVSLHAPTQTDRARLLPIAKKYPLDGVLAAARQYVHLTGRKVTFEYTVVPGWNDRNTDAIEIAKITRHLQCLVNVIPLNPTGDLPRDMRRSPQECLESAEMFLTLLRRHHVEASLRRSRGGDVLGACGQLRGEAPE